MCGCSSPVSGAVNVYRVSSPPPPISINCEITYSELELIQQDLLIRKTPENASFVNRSLGKIQTMINNQNYCLYSLDEIRI